MRSTASYLHSFASVQTSSAAPALADSKHDEHPETIPLPFPVGCGAVKALIVIPARGGLKGLPQKGIPAVGGVSLVGRTVVTARGFVTSGRRRHTVERRRLHRLPGVSAAPPSVCRARTYARRTDAHRALAADPYTCGTGVGGRNPRAVRHTGGARRECADRRGGALFHHRGSRRQSQR